MNSNFQNQIFTVVKFEPYNVVLQHSITRKLYRYAQLQREMSVEVDHQLIIKAEPLCSGFTYQKQLTTLAKQLRPKIASENKDHFDQTELNNTFEPILNFLKSGKHHGGINLENILIDSNGNIRLKDPKITKQSDSMKNDFQRLGFIMLQCALLKNEDAFATIQFSKLNLTNILLRFSAKFIANIWILLNNQQALFQKINFTQDFPCCDQYRSIVNEIESHMKKMKQKKFKHQFIRISEEKKIIVIPPLNLKFNKAKKADNKKINLSGKRQSRNENENEEESQTKIINWEGKQKNTNSKILSKNNEIKLKFKKLQLIDNFRSPLKRKGKTIEKKIK